MGGCGQGFGKGGQNHKHLAGRGGGNGALGLWGRPAVIVGRAVMGWITEWRRCTLINPASSGVIY